MAWRRRIAAWTIASVVVACGAKTSDAPADAGASDDAGVDPTRGDGDTDGAVADTGPDAGSSFCAKNPGHDFCEDFDRPVQIGGDRFHRSQVNEDSARLVQENGALRADIVVIDAGAGVFAPAWLWVERPWARLADQSRPRVVLRHKLRVEECPTSSVNGPTVMAGVDRGDFYTWTVDELVYFDVDCRVRLYGTSHREVDGGPKSPLGYSQSDFISIPIKEWLDVTVDVKEEAANRVKAVLRIGTQQVTLDFEARSQIDELSLLFGAAKLTSANVSARYLFDDLLLDSTDP